MDLNDHTECPVCLDPLPRAALSLGCCFHSYHAGCLISAFQDDVLHQWRCPCCRATVDPSAVTIARRAADDLESCSRGGAAGGTAAKQGSRLAAVRHFITTCRHALLLERLEAAGKKSACCFAPSSPSRSRSTQPQHTGSASSLLDAVERQLPAHAVAAAAAALASLHLQSLLHPGQRSIAGMCARWAGGAALLVCGCIVLVALLGQVLLRGMVLLTSANVATARLFGLEGGSVPPPLRSDPGHWCLVLLLCIATMSASTQVVIRRHNSLAKVFLHLDRHAPSLIVLLAAVSLSLAIGVLVATWLFSTAALVGACLMSTESLLQPDSSPFWQIHAVSP